MKTHTTQKAIGKILIVLILTVAEFAITSAQAQDFHRRNYAREGSTQPVVALTAALGTRSFLVKSDIDYLNGMRPNLEGWESSLMIGGRHVRVRTGFGNYGTSITEKNTIKQASFNGLMNLYFPSMAKRFRPYVVTGIDVNILTFKGTYVPTSPLILTPLITQCVCQTPAGGLLPPPPNPGDNDTTMQPEEPASSEESTPSTSTDINSGKMTSTQVVGGFGGELYFPVNGRFFSVFGEMRYGFPIGTTTQNASMNETKVKHNTAITFGVAIGLHGQRGARKIKIR